MFLLWHPSLTAINLSYTFPILETSATALCGTTGMLCDMHMSWFSLSILMQCMFGWRFWEHLYTSVVTSRYPISIICCIPGSRRMETWFFKVRWGKASHGPWPPPVVNCQTQGLGVSPRHRGCEAKNMKRNVLCCQHLGMNLMMDLS